MNWTLEKRKVTDLHEYAKNARKLNKLQGSHLQESINKFGQCEPIVINRDNVVIGGHQRLRVMRKLGHKQVDVYVPDTALIEKEVEELNIRLNKNVGDWDWDMLGNAWDPTNLVDWGFTEEELSVDIDSLEGKEPEDNAILVAEEAITKPGDVYILGNHRLVCGSSTDALDVEKLLGGALVQMLCTDPPYGVDYASKNEMLNSIGKSCCNTTPILNDSIKDYRQFFGEFLSLIPWEEKNTAYIFMSAQDLHNLRMAMEDNKMKCSDYLIWVKNTHVLNRKDYNCKHEFIAYGWKGTHEFFGPTNSVTTIEWDKPYRSKEHPTMKPIGLISKLIKDGSKKGYIVYDAFAGSGTTLLACESLDRVCYSMELSPQYCDVIVNRWIKYRKENNQPYDILINGEKRECLSEKGS